MLENQGFTVKGEVKNCDIAALCCNELWIVELKRHLSIKLLCQAISKLSITPHVFIAIPRPKTNNKDFKLVQKILKKLGIGLITVALDSPVKLAEIILLPAEEQKDIKKQNKKSDQKKSDPKKSDPEKLDPEKLDPEKSGPKKSAPKKLDLIREEIKSRTQDTPGGSTKITITTAYRERCIKIACILSSLKESISPANLVKQHDSPKDTGNILYKNYYGWFERMGHGKYTLSQEGHQYLEDNSKNPLVLYYQENLHENLQ